MTEEHNYGEVSHEEIVHTDPLESMQLAIAALTETVQKLAQRINISQGMVQLRLIQNQQSHKTTSLFPFTVIFPPLRNRMVL